MSIKLRAKMTEREGAKVVWVRNDEINLINTFFGNLIILAGRVGCKLRKTGLRLAVRWGKSSFYFVGRENFKQDLRGEESLLPPCDLVSDNWGALIAMQ